MIFLDTGFLFALISTRDEHHERVVDVYQALKTDGLTTNLLTTNHVMSETITLARRVGHDEASRIGELLCGEATARIHWATPEEERAAFAWFKRHRDQTYSFVDA